MGYLLQKLDCIWYRDAESEYDDHDAYGVTLLKCRDLFLDTGCALAFEHHCHLLP